MSASQIKAGEAFIVISAKIDQLRADLNKGKAELKSWGSSLSGVAANVTAIWSTVASSAVVAGMTAAVKAFADAGSEINDMAARTGIATAKLQEFRFAAKQSGATLADVEAAARHFVKKGFDIKEMEAVGKTIASLEDPSERAAQAIEMFGKSGTRLIPMFQDFATLKAISKELGPILSEEEVRRADELGDAFGALQESWSRFMQQAGSKFSDQVLLSLQDAIGMTSQLGKLWASNEHWKLFVPGFGQAEMLRMFMEADKIGRRVTDATREASAVNDGYAESLDGIMNAAERTKHALKSHEAMVRALEAGEKRRAALLQQHETDGQRFLRQQKEIFGELAAVNRNRVLGFMDEGQAAAERRALEGALANLRAAEAKRIGKPLVEATVDAEKRRLDLMKDQLSEREKLILKEKELQQAIMTAPAMEKAGLAEALKRVHEAQAKLFAGGSAGTFSAVGAGQLSRAAPSNAERELKVHTKLLQGIERGVRLIEGAPKFT